MRPKSIKGYVAVLGLLLLQCAGALPARAENDGWACPSEKARVSLQEALAGHPPIPDCDANQASMNYCAQVDFYAADRDLAAAVARTSAGLADGADSQMLDAAQQAWCRYRDADCQAEVNNYAGGSMVGHVLGACLAAHDRQRQDTLIRFLACGKDCASSLEKFDFHYSFRESELGTQDP